MTKWPLLIFMFLFIFSCGKNSTDEINDAVLSANISLSYGDCQSAIDSLEGIGRQNKNANYLKTLSSAYACRAGYSATSFFANDLTLTTSVAPLGGMSRYSMAGLSYQIPLELDQKFVDLKTAIEILLFAGGISSTTEPTRTQRAKYFSSAELDDIDTQLLFMQLTQVGIIMRVYGDTSAAGVKGGANVFNNNCFSDYPNAPAAIGTALGAFTGACKVTNDSGHPQLRSSVTSAVRIRRLCHGVVALNGLMASLGNIAGSLSGSSGTTATASSALATAAQTALTTAFPGIGIVKSTMSQTLCEDTSLVPIDELESYYAIMYDGLIQ